jgi:hypothetical protein
MTPSRLLTNGLALSAVALLGLLAFWAATARDTYTYRINFDTVPASHEAFQQWLAAQPGVTSASVSTSGDAVVVEYAMPWYRGSPRVDPVAEARRFGYGRYWRATCIHQLRW